MVRTLMLGRVSAVVLAHVSVVDAYFPGCAYSSSFCAWFHFMYLLHWKGIAQLLSCAGYDRVLYTAGKGDRATASPDT